MNRSLKTFRWSAIGVFSYLVMLAVTIQSAPADLVIIPTFGESITGDDNGYTDQQKSAMMNGINFAIAQVESKIKNDVTVKINFENSGSKGLGTSVSFIDTDMSYTDFRSLLATNQILSADDVTAQGTLPNAPDGALDGRSSMVLTLPLLRAISNGSMGANTGSDSTIKLAMDLMNYERTGTQDPQKYDLAQVTMHEILEVLGAGGSGTTLGGSRMGTHIGSLDLFRYSAPGVRSFDEDLKTDSYFSFDGGTTNLSFFDQDAGGDFADWDGKKNFAAGKGYQVQDAFSTPGLQLDLSTTELRQLDVVGWDLKVAAVPEPSSLIFVAIAGSSLLRRKRR